MLRQILLQATIPAVAASGDIEERKFVITSSCIENIQISKNDYDKNWGVYIFLKKDAGDELYEFSDKNLKKTITFVTSDGLKLTTALVMEPVSTSLAVVADEDNAHHIRSAILSSEGNCGEVK
ncbi:MAG: hypothetical protein G8D81_15210 [gamma proteobacterium symbiont of Clathrolucina costata]|uniref:Uncharacterized protein n=1 Tax=Candidatus Thiodiazotropha taylori TaxID=2792791 RepID=A0A9E4TVL3_9GAMM|nr:hypothetical protein [Candidatus Thiodiazotropha taylori]MCW4239171.1 hypothetical protein [Candidatus Thiodiazotropha endolucinida]